MRFIGLKVFFHAWPFTLTGIKYTATRGETLFSPKSKLPRVAKHFIEKKAHCRKWQITFFGIKAPCQAWRNAFEQINLKTRLSSVFYRDKSIMIGMVTDFIKIILLIKRRIDSL
jgi:hypothetical protein